MTASVPRIPARTYTTDNPVLGDAKLKEREMITPLNDERLPRESPKAFEHDPFIPPEYDSLSVAHAPASSEAHMQRQRQSHLVASSSLLEEEAEAPLPPSPSPSSSSSRAEERKGGGVLRALGSGFLAILLPPVAILGVACAARGFIVYGAGKVVERVGRGIAAGPEAARVRKGVYLTKSGT
ncbi:hypothetical protein C8Q80DRAFT_1266818 [Daedaleopsis nitida]|nr:hypothetical protein C8Q80DRAFT_1266818 [Daedaleopsis nitida]